MLARMQIFKAFLIAFTLLVDIYAFVAIYSLMKDQSSLVRYVITLIFWSITLSIILAFIFFFRFESGNRNPSGLAGVFLFFGIYVLVYLPKLVFLGFRGMEDVIWTGSWLVKMLAKPFSGFDLSLLRWNILSKIGMVFSALSFIVILWGLVIGRFHYKVEQVPLSVNNLPEALQGLRIVQISDIHIGSLYGKEKQVRKAIDRINSLQPDLIVFTGDLVNNFSEEAHGWENLFETMQAHYGKFSILGNHDYGDYWEWGSEDERKNNMTMLYDVHREMGFRLLRNEWDTVRINGELLTVVGVENWGQPPFKQIGDLDQALKGIPDSTFKILLSHDPTHWDAKVLYQTDIPLTFSGHTHAMQFGIKLGRFSWSPSKYIYKRWMGLYKENEQFLYVNRGLGFIGFPGRIGLRPEITLVTLYNKPIETP
jgi:uncharacterized protein